VNHQQLTIVGRVGRDPEVRYAKSGEPIVSFSVAVSETWNKAGEKQERTTWFNCTAFGNTAKVARDYVKKGTLLLIVGRIQTDEWTDKDGNQKKGWKVIVDRLQLGPKPSGEGRPAAPRREDAPTSPEGAPKTRENGWTPTDDDVPF